VETFISEDDLKSFDKWLEYQGVDAAGIDTNRLEEWHRIFEEMAALTSAAPKVGLVKLKQLPGEYRYAVASRENGNLWLTLWVRRSRKGEFFVMVPRGDRAWNVHTSYHLDGQLHMKSYGQKTVEKKVQPLTGTFQGTVDLGTYGGHAPKGVGAVCDPSAFNGVVEVEPGILGPRQGSVAVELVEPGREPTVALSFNEIVRRQVFADFVSSVAITIWAPGEITGCAEMRDNRVYTSGPAGTSLQHKPWASRSLCGSRLLALPGETCMLLCESCARLQGLLW